MAAIALTTTFTPPASCFDNVYTSLGGGVYEKDVSIVSSECYPSGFRTLFSEAVPFSPGLCPSGYGYDSTTSYGDDATAALCCPMGMTAYDSGLGCNTQVSEATELYVGGSTITVDEAVLAVHGVYVAWGSGDQPASNAADPTSSSLEAYPLPTAYAIPSQSSLAAFTQSMSGSGIQASTSTSDAVASSSGSATTRSIQTRSSSSLTPPSNLQPTALPPYTVPATASNSHSSETPSKHDLSTGAKAGIGVGVSVIVVGVAAALAWVVLSRRRRQQATQPAYYQPEMVSSTAERAAANKAHHVSELSTEGGRSELSGDQPWIERS